MIHTLFINYNEDPLNNTQDEYTNQTTIDETGYDIFSRSIILLMAFMLIGVSFWAPRDRFYRCLSGIVVVV